MGRNGVAFEEKVIAVPDYGRVKATGGEKLFKKKSIFVSAGDLATLPTGKKAGHIYKSAESPAVRFAKDTKVKAVKTIGPHVLDKLIHKMGDWRNQSYSFEACQQYIQSRGLFWHPEQLKAMFEEADFRGVGCLSRDDLHAALTYRFKHRKYNKEWRQLAAVLLEVNSIKDPLDKKKLPLDRLRASEPGPLTGGRPASSAAASLSDSSRPASSSASSRVSRAASAASTLAWSVAPSSKSVPVLSPVSGELAVHLSKVQTMEAKRVGTLLPQGDAVVPTTWGPKSLKQQDQESALNTLLRQGTPEAADNAPTVSMQAQSKFRAVDVALQSQERKEYRGPSTNPATASVLLGRRTQHGTYVYPLDAKPAVHDEKPKGFNTLSAKPQGKFELMTETHKGQSGFHGEFVDQRNAPKLRSYKKDNPVGVDIDAMERAYSSVANTVLKVMDKSKSLGYQQDLRPMEAAEKTTTRKVNKWQAKLLK